MAKKENKRKVGSGKARKSSSGAFVRLILIFIVILSAVFLPTAVFLFVGLLPTFVAFFVDSSKKKKKCITVGALNLAGCIPFLMELWTTDHTFSKAMNLLLDPAAIVMIYSAAGLGYLMDWLLTILISGYLYQRGVTRLKNIKKYQQDLIDRWGKEVARTMLLDAEGFPIEEDLRS